MRPHALYISPLVLMTYHQLKRTNIIMSYVENARVLQGTVDLCKVPHAVYIAVYYSILQYIIVYHSISQYIAVYHSICMVPHAKYHVKVHRTFALWYNMALVYFTAACEGGGVERRSGTCRGQENCQKVMVA